jgi:hypothetical protein
VALEGRGGVSGSGMLVVLPEAENGRESDARRSSEFWPAVGGIGVLRMRRDERNDGPLFEWVIDSNSGMLSVAMDSVRACLESSVALLDRPSPSRPEWRVVVGVEIIGPSMTALRTAILCVVLGRVGWS